MQLPARRSIFGLCAGLMIVPSLAIIIPTLHDGNVRGFFVVVAGLVTGMVLLIVMITLTLQADPEGAGHRGKHRA